MIADADVAVAAGLIGDPTRAAFLLALSEDEALPASELARRAGVAVSTASEQLARLLDGGLVAAERHGRHRYFRLADPAVAAAIEALAVIAPRRPARGRREVLRGEAIRLARTCYDHLAGRLGVELTAALVRDGTLVPEGGSFAVSPVGAVRLGALGLDLDALARERRAFARACLDWSERRDHLAGALGAALARRLLELGWVERRTGGRALRVTQAGGRALRDEFGVAL